MNHDEVSEAAGGSEDPPSSVHSAATVYSPQHWWLVRGLRWVVHASVLVLVFAAAREAFDVFACHGRTGRDLVRRSSDGVGISSFTADSPEAQLASSVPAGTTTNHTGNGVGFSSARLKLYMSALEATAPGACVPQFPGVSYLPPTEISIESVLQRA